jgi:hypothetical protein
MVAWLLTSVSGPPATECAGFVYSSLPDGIHR